VGAIGGPPERSQRPAKAATIWADLAETAGQVMHAFRSGMQTLYWLFDPKGKPRFWQEQLTHE
jgi:hypothetical protein